MTAKDPALSATDLVEDSASVVDWEELRERSLRPGGFGSERLEIWPRLLNVSTIHAKEHLEDEQSPAAEEHHDERQIRLDTDRSFVIYPVDSLSSDSKEAMQEKLNRLLVSIFRRHPKLNYFQGYHDIISVLFLTLPDSLQLPCAEKISLHRVRDSMGTTLEPVLGLLRVTKALLRLVDLEYAQSLERSSPLPFYAISNLLTLFSHDMPTLPLIQHVFDYILCRPPIIIVYLATAIILSRKDEIKRLEEDDEDGGMGMAHSLLSTLPPISDALDQECMDIKVEERPVDVRDESVCTEKQKTQSGLESNRGHIATVKAEDRSEDIETTTTTSRDCPRSDGTEEILDNGLEEKSSPPTIRSLSSAPVRIRKPAHITLSSLLTQSDELYTLYPPSHPELSLSSTMGPQSVVYTWSKSPGNLPTDEEAEAMVSRPELVVYPYIEEEEAEEGDEDVYEWEKSESKSSRRKRVKGKLRERVKGKLGRLRRLKPERRTGTMVAGAVLVLGVAVAVYGIKTRGMHAGSGIYGAARADGQVREWRKVAGWLGSAVVGVTERVFSKSSSSEHLHD